MQFFVSPMIPVGDSSVECAAEYITHTDSEWDSMNAPDGPAQGKTSKGLRLLISIVCLLFFLGGCTAGMMAYRGIQEAQQSLQWPTVVGRIVRSGVDVSVHRDRSTDRDRRNRETRSYSAGIEYEFEVNGQPVNGSRITVISDQFGSKSWAEATSQKFPVGTEVKVSYNPTKPEQCVLEPGGWGGVGFLLILSAVFGLFPPLVLKGIWSTKPVETGFHPETRAERILQGLEFRERILTWEPGKLVHLQRDSISFLSLIGGAIIAGLFVGLLFGLVPALVFFSGRGPVFIGQCYLGASALCAAVGAVWLWLDNRRRETRIDWSTQSIHLAVGSSVRDVFFTDVQELNVSVPKPKKPGSESSSQPPQKQAARISMVVNGKSYVILETECASTAVRAVRSKLASIAQQLTVPMNVQFAKED
jgi:hypothetical protein